MLRRSGPAQDGGARSASKVQQLHIMPVRKAAYKLFFSYNPRIVKKNAMDLKKNENDEIHRQNNKFEI